MTKTRTTMRAQVRGCGGAFVAATIAVAVEPLVPAAMIVTTRSRASSSCARNMLLDFIMLVASACVVVDAATADGDGDDDDEATFNPTFEPTAAAETTETRAQGASEMVRNVVVILLAGIAIILGLLALTYAIAAMFDRFCSRFDGSSAQTAGGLGGSGDGFFVDNDGADAGSSSRAHYDTGLAARKAGLYGLTLSERGAVLDRVFESTTATYRSGTIEACDDDDIGTPENNNKASTCMGATTEAVRDAGTVAGSATIMIGVMPKCSRSDQGDEAASALDGVEGVDTDVVDRDKLCSICLAAYRDGDRFMTGTTGCGHRFHSECCMEWLRDNDHCPYCRVPMFRPEEMRSVAVDVLGQGRVGDLTVGLALRWSQQQQQLQQHVGVEEAATGREGLEMVRVDGEQRNSNPHEQGGRGSESP